MGHLHNVMEIIILMDKYIRKYMNGPGEVNVFVLYCSIAFLKTKKVRTTSTNWFLTMEIFILMNKYTRICINGQDK